AIMLSVALATVPTAALADAQVRGSPEAVTIEARNTSVEEILKALSGAFDVHYRSSANLQMRVTGNYEGSLHRVMKRVLDGYSYFVKTAEGRIDLTVLDAPRTAPSTDASPPFRVVAPPADAVPAQPQPVIAAVEPSLIPRLRARPRARRPFLLKLAPPPPLPPRAPGGGGVPASPSAPNPPLPPPRPPRLSSRTFIAQTRPSRRCQRDRVAIAAATQN